MYTSNGHVLDESPRRLGRLEPVPDHERLDRDALWARLTRDGYLYLTGHLDRQRVLEFRAYYFSMLAGSGLLVDGTEPADGIGADGPLDNELIRHRLFREILPGRPYAQFATQPAISEWFAWFFAEPVHLHKRKLLRHVRPGAASIGTATQAHYDLVYLREGSDNVLTMWIPLGDCTSEMGGLVYLEGSHRWARADERERGVHRPPRWMTADLPALAEEHDQRWLLADYRAGDVVIHSAYTVHAGTDNVDAAGRVRLSTDIRYQRGSEPVDQRWQDHWREDDGL